MNHSDHALTCKLLILTFNLLRLEDVIKGERKAARRDMQGFQFTKAPS